MSKFKYQFINNEHELKDNINNMDKVANEYLMKIEDLYIEDLYFMSVIDKSIKLIDSFLFAFDKKNLTVLAILTRVQMDCVMRAFATTMVKDSGEFCKAILNDNVRINNLKDVNNHQLTDKHICEVLGKHLNLPLYDLYKKVCGFVHFSSDSFRSISKSQDKNSITMYISRNNRDEDKQIFEQLSLELANYFLFFGLVLIKKIFASWLEQKKRWNDQ